ncbi:MAG: amidohydrolase family protein [Cellvibrio sp.]|uniref:amidohydrolase family protein n=1 Tax=Cellvibrio sp. TaxID=1965322 RepID=UPI0031A33396
MYKTMCIALSFIFLSSCAIDKTANIEADYIVENVNVIAMDKPVAKNNMAVAIKEGKIVAIISQSRAHKINANKRVDGEHRYLMPGLADMHIHVRWKPQTMFNLFLAQGVTTVANMWLLDGDGAIDHLQLRDQIAAGEVVGPRYLVGGVFLGGDFPATLAEVESVLDEHQKKRIDFVKIHDDIDSDIYNAIIAGAKKRGLNVRGHAQRNKPLKNSLSLNSLEHMEEFLYVSRDTPFAADNREEFLSDYRANAERLLDNKYRAQVVNDIATSGIYVDPTLIVYKMVGEWASDEHLAAMRNNPELEYLPADVREHWLNPATNPYQEEGFPLTKAEVDHNLKILFLLTKELHDAGVPLLTGTDTFGTLVPGLSLHQELSLFVEAGLTPFEALKCSTVNVANYLGEKGKAGVIQVGARADFILLDKNPLIDIRNTRSVSGVYTNARWFSRADINELLESARHH